MNTMKKNKKLYFVVLALMSLFLIGCDGVKETFTLGWVDSKQVVHLKYSYDGNTWKDVKLPAQLTSKVGPSVIADPSGLMHCLLVVYPNDDLRGIQSVGVNQYTLKKPVKITNVQNQPMSSGASMASMTGDRWYIAYRSGSIVKVMYITDTYGSTPTFRNETPAAGVNNTNVQGWPSISIKDSRAVVSWYRIAEGGKGQLQMVVGDVNTLDGNIKWTRSYVFLKKEPNAGDVKLPHDLCHNGKEFFLAVIRDDIPIIGVANNTLYVYKSTDGISWTLYTSVGVKTPSIKRSFNPFTPVGIAANSKGFLVVSQPGSNGFKNTYRYVRQWFMVTDLNSIYPPKNKYFSLIGNAPSAPAKP